MVGLLKSRDIWTGSLGLALNWGLCASAQAAPGDHIRLGDSTTIAPEVGVGFELESNPYRSVGAVQSNAPRDRAVLGFLFLLTPRFVVDVDTPKVTFDFDGRYELRKWFSERFANLDRFTDFNIDTKLQILPQGVVGFTLNDHAVLRNRASDNPFRQSALLSQFRNDLGGFVNIRVGPELVFDLGTSWAWHNYRVPGAASQRPFNTRNTIQPELKVNWRFFPKTAFVAQAQVGLNRWEANWVATDQQVFTAEDGAEFSLGQFLALPDSTHVKGMVGIRGRITEHLVLVAMAGYGVGTYSVDSVADEAGGGGAEADPTNIGFDQNVSAVDGILATVRTELDYGYDKQRKFGQEFAFLYRKDFQDSFFTNYVHQHHLKATLDSRWGRIVTSAIHAGVQFENYYGEVDRTDVVLDFGGDIGVQATPWFGMHFGGGWMQRASSQRELQWDNAEARVIAVFSY